MVTGLKSDVLQQQKLCILYMYMYMYIHVHTVRGVYACSVERELAMVGNSSVWLVYVIAKVA